MFYFPNIYFDQILSGPSASTLTQPFSIILLLDELCSFFISISWADLYMDDSTDLFKDDSFNFASCILSTLSIGVLIFCRELWIECLLLNGESLWINVFEPLALCTFMESSLDPGWSRISGMIYKYEKFWVTHLLPMHPFSTPRKSLKTWRFSEKGALGTNGLR